MPRLVLAALIVSSSLLSACGAHPTDGSGSSSGYTERSHDRDDGC
ncbi:hypothetical protein [Neotabrizicola sp. sgz301269]